MALGRHHLSETERQRCAVEAAEARDHEELWSLVDAHLATYGQRGLVVSP